MVNKFLNKKVGILLLCTLLAVLFLMPVGAKATPVDAHVKYLGIGTVAVRNAGTDFSYGAYAGTYRILLDGVGISVMCDDVTATISSGMEWDAIVWGFEDIGDTPGKFETLKYSQVASLYQQTYGVTDADILANLNQAIWKIMSPGAGITLTTAAQTYYTAALSQSAFDWSNIMEVITPDPFVDGQEFLKPVAAPVPEPATMVLLGFGLIGLAGLGRRKLLKS